MVTPVLATLIRNNSSDNSVVENKKKITAINNNNNNNKSNVRDNNSNNNNNNGSTNNIVTVTNTNDNNTNAANATMMTAATTMAQFNDAKGPVAVGTNANATFFHDKKCSLPSGDINTAAHTHVHNHHKAVDSCVVHHSSHSHHPHSSVENFNADEVDNEGTESLTSFQAETETETDNETADGNKADSLEVNEQQNITSVPQEEMDLRMIRTRSGKHIFEPAFYQVDTTNGYEYRRRYIYEKTLGSTLQGYACLAKDRVNNRKVAIKVANKIHIIKKQSMTGTFVAEDFIKEIAILKKISTHKLVHHGFAKWIDEWETAEQKYLAIEYCAGGDLFEYTQQVLHKHPLLQAKAATREARRQLMTSETVYARFMLVQNIFAQMVTVVNYLHNVVQICHMDISLENFMIANSDSEFRPILKLIDFGLAVDFSERPQDHFMYDGCVGKLKYQSPECYDCRHKELQRRYDSRLNDTYCLGVCLFMLLFAQHPYERPSIRSDPHCMQLMQNGLMPFVESKEYQFLVNKETVHLLDHLLRPASNRYYVDQIAKHPFFTKCVYVQHNSKR